MSIPDPDRSVRSLARGVLVVRWVAFVWMTVLAAAGTSDFDHPLVAWVSVGVAGAWTVYLTADVRRDQRRRNLSVDLAVSCGLVLVSGVVVRTGGVVGGASFLATAYPASAILAWGVRGGPKAGTLAGTAVGLCLALSRPINGIPFGSLLRTEIQSLLTGVVLYVVAGLSVGLVSRLLRRSADELRVAMVEAIRQRERAARLAERESMARHIHDSVLQTLAMIHKRGKEIAKARRVDRKGIESMADLAATQEDMLRALILREPEDLPGEALSLRDALEEASRNVDGLKVEVSTVGALLLQAPAAQQVAAAVAQLLQNVANHAGTDRATVFAEVEDGTLVVSVRDDGTGFEYDPLVLRDRGKMGLAKSVIGRVEDLGGSVRVQSSAGAGTLVEINVPVRSD
jgi:signal transduction histidine kinase